MLPVRQYSIGLGKIGLILHPNIVSPPYPLIRRLSGVHSKKRTLNVVFAETGPHVIHPASLYKQNLFLSHSHTLSYVDGSCSACVGWGGWGAEDGAGSAKATFNTTYQQPKPLTTLMYKKKNTVFWSGRIPVVGEVGGADVVALSGGTNTVGTGSTQIRTRFDISPMLADLQKRTVYI